jgi:hypothetical protein
MHGFLSRIGIGVINTLKSYCAGVEHVVDHVERNPWLSVPIVTVALVGSALVALAIVHMALARFGYQLLAGL